MIGIDGNLCDLCGTCVGVCPVDALTIEGSSVHLDRPACTGCRFCVSICPVGAISEYEDVPGVVFPII